MSSRARFAGGAVLAVAVALWLQPSAAQVPLSAAHARMQRVLNDFRDQPMPKGDDAVLVYQCYLECNRLLPKVPEVLHAKLAEGELGEVVPAGAPLLPGDIHTFKQEGEGGRVTFGLQVEGTKFLTHDPTRSQAIIADLALEPWKRTHLSTRRIIPADDTSYMPPVPTSAATPEPSPGLGGTPTATGPQAGGGGSVDPLWVAAAVVLALVGAWALRRGPDGAPKAALPPTVSDRLAALDDELIKLEKRSASVTAKPGAPAPAPAAPAAPVAPVPPAATAPQAPAPRPAPAAAAEQEPSEFDLSSDDPGGLTNPGAKLRPETEADVLARLRTADKPPRRK